MVIYRTFITVAQNDFDMRNTDTKATTEPAVYKPGCRREVKVADRPTKLKVGKLGLDAIVKPNK